MPMTIRSVTAGFLLAVVAVTSCSSGDQPDANEAAKAQALIAAHIRNCPLRAIAPQATPNSPWLGWGGEWNCAGKPVESGIDLYVRLEVEQAGGSWYTADMDSTGHVIAARDGDLWTATWCKGDPGERTKVRTVVQGTISYDDEDGLPSVAQTPDTVSDEVLIHCVPKKSKKDLG